MRAGIELPSGGVDADYPEWFAWAKGELLADDDHAHAAAQAAVRAGTAGQDQAACQAAATAAAAGDPEITPPASVEMQALAERLWAKREAKAHISVSQPSLISSIWNPTVIAALSVGLVAVAVALFGASVLLLILPGSPLQLSSDAWSVQLVIGIVSQGSLVAGFAVFGALIVTRQARSILGWLFCAVAVAEGLGDFAQIYAVGATETGLGLPAISFAAWIAAWLQIVSVPMAGTLVLLLAPDGLLPSPRWRTALWVSVIAVLYLAAIAAFTSGALRSDSSVDNPIGFIPASRSPFAGLVLTSVVLCIASAFARYRNGDPEARRQLRWVVAAAIIFGLGYIGNAVLAFTGTHEGWPARFGAAGIALTVGTAVVRYTPRS